MVTVPRWYLTSPLPSSAGSKVLNWVKIDSNGWRATFAKTFKRPRWGIPMAKFSTPNDEALSITCFMAGIKTSHPSNPNRLSDGHFFAKNSSNLTTIIYLFPTFNNLNKQSRKGKKNAHLVERIKRLNKTFFWSGGSSVTWGVSKCSRIQFCWSKLLMCIYSMPIWPQ